MIFMIHITMWLRSVLWSSPGWSSKLQMIEIHRGSSQSIFFPWLQHGFCYGFTASPMNWNWQTWIWPICTNKKKLCMNMCNIIYVICMYVYIYMFIHGSAAWFLETLPLERSHFALQELCGKRQDIWICRMRRIMESMDYMHTDYIDIDYVYIICMYI